MSVLTVDTAIRKRTRTLGNKIRPLWIIFDGPLDPQRCEPLYPLLEFGKPLCLGNGEFLGELFSYQLL